MNDLLSVAEMAQELNVTTRTIRNYIAEGKLQGKKVGGQWRFLKSELYNFIGDVDQLSEQDLIDSLDDEFAATLVINIPFVNLEKINKLKDTIIQQYNNVYEGNGRTFSYQLKSEKNARITIQGNYDYLSSFGNWIYSEIEKYKQ